jgi:hypothetical protein
VADDTRRHVLRKEMTKSGLARARKRWRETALFDQPLTTKGVPPPSPLSVFRDRFPERDFLRVGCVFSKQTPSTLPRELRLGPALTPDREFRKIVELRAQPADAAQVVEGH